MNSCIGAREPLNIWVNPLVNHGRLTSVKSAVSTARYTVGDSFGKNSGLARNSFSGRNSWYAQSTLAVRSRWRSKRSRIFGSSDGIRFADVKGRSLMWQIPPRSDGFRMPATVEPIPAPPPSVSM